MRFILTLLTWYHGSTLGMRLFTLMKGVRVGEDDRGNVFYKTRDGRRRWVVYAGDPEASKVNPEWHGWLHFTWDEPPTEVPLTRKPWEKPHRENPTGTSMAHAPVGSIRRHAPAPRGDYEAWQPAPRP